MIRLSPFVAVPWLVVAFSTGLAQTKETPQARAAYARVVAMRNDFERAHGRFVAVNGIRMHYLEWGDAKGVPLVWAHGSGSDGYELRHVAPRLAEAGYRVLAVDYRGHGRTRATRPWLGAPINVASCGPKARASISAPLNSSSKLD